MPEALSVERPKTAPPGTKIAPFVVVNVDDGATVSATPVPLSDTVRVPALLEIVTVAEREPPADGTNRTWNVHENPGDRFAPVQLSDDLGKSPGLVPPTLTLETDRVDVPVLVTVTVLFAL